MNPVLAAAAILVTAVSAAPTSASVSPTISTQPQLASALSALGGPAQPSFAANYAALMSAISPSAKPTTDADFASRLSAAYSADQNPLYQAAQLQLNGVASIRDFDDLNTYGVCNSYSNIGNPKPRQNIYPKSAKDAPYSVPELALRSAIYIPSNFTYGRKAPVILIPGTGVEACESFYTNYYKLLKQTDYADPVFLNVPDNLLDDQQTNAEYVAYATNYIASISGRNVTTVSWSAGSICGQWARKYWPSTRSVTDSANHVSADYHGTTLVPLICPPGIPCSPAVLQQNYNSTWIQTLRNNGGDSAYTATTSCWSVYDEIVEPQTDPGASAHVNNANGAPVLNAQVQQICGSASLAGAPNFGHEGALYNAVCYALISDAIKHNGVADLQRSGAQAMCNQLYTPGLDLIDNLVTESTIPIAALNIELYPKKVLTEPAIRTYAQKDIPK